MSGKAAETENSAPDKGLLTRLHDNFQKSREPERHRKCHTSYSLHQEVLVAPVLRDSESLPQSRGSSYSIKEDGTTRPCPLASHMWFLTQWSPVSLLQFPRNWTRRYQSAGMEADKTGNMSTEFDGPECNPSLTEKKKKQNISTGGKTNKGQKGKWKYKLHLYFYKLTTICF